MVVMFPWILSISATQDTSDEPCLIVAVRCLELASDYGQVCPLNRPTDPIGARLSGGD
jgi:hypothetical protein